MNDQILVRFSWSLNRRSLGSVFETTRERLEQFPGLPVYFGEVDGKHSEVHGRLQASNFEVLAANPEEIGAIKRVLGSFPCDVDIEDAIDRAVEGFCDDTLDVEDVRDPRLIASVLMPGDPGYAERKAARKAQRDALRCKECHKIPSEHGGGTYSHERYCSNPTNRSPSW